MPAAADADPADQAPRVDMDRLRPEPALAPLLAGTGVDVVDAAASQGGLLRLLRG